MGEIAGLATAILWTLSSVIFTSATKRVGSLAVNWWRLLMAAVMLMGIHWVFYGQPLPLNAAPDRWLYLGLSGIIGLAIGDAFLYQAYYLVGARITTLLLATSPVLSSLLAFLFLGEKLALIEIGGISLTIAGVAWVVIERSGANGAEGTGSRKDYITGVLFGLAAAAGQAVGLVFAKRGLYGDFPSLSGVIMRMTISFLALNVFALPFGRVPAVVRGALNDRRAFLTLLGGSVVGPVFGIWLSMVAVQLAPVGVASTLFSLMPILILPIAHFFMKEKISPRAVFGTISAVAGVALIFMH